MADTLLCPDNVEGICGKRGSGEIRDDKAYPVGETAAPCIASRPQDLVRAERDSDDRRTALSREPEAGTPESTTRVEHTVTNGNVGVIRKHAVGIRQRCGVVAIIIKAEMHRKVLAIQPGRPVIEQSTSVIRADVRGVRADILNRARLPVTGVSRRVREVSHCPHEVLRYLHSILGHDGRGRSVG